MRALVARLAARLRPGRHRATHLGARVRRTPPAPVSPWNRPFTGPTQAQVRTYFARQAATPLRTRFLHRGHRTLYIAPQGIDLPLLALLAGPPAPRRETCCVCGRTTAAPVEIRDVMAPGGRIHTLYSCPHHIDAGLTGPGGDHLQAGARRRVS
ncbi:hypothetical protein [Streptomyces qinzhouensis]|uniref:Uncharacterized protein n=1 Tax=Streptomyces qinzhouensis TaxID=2599401 RepID=A0A5B8JGT2_9ACTN|nr:hypothetical protein [Streptomyces qinzhouensis]QDY76960.1 hypothetical protein FQU76_10980 [Streptomyces qinzhouensis]